MRWLTASVLIGWALLAGAQTDSFAETWDDAGGWTIVSEDDLDAQRGGQPIPLSDITTEASIHDNALVSTATGMNTVGEGAFTGATGLVTVIQNSGNQVVIQDSTIINLTLN